MEWFEHMSVWLLAAEDRPLTREIFGNVDKVSKILFYLLAFASMAIFAYGIWKRVRLWRLGRPAGSKIDWSATWRGFWGKVMSQRTLRHGKRKRAGVIHSLMFWGFTVLFIGTVLVGIEEYASVILGRSAGDPVFHKGYYYAVYEVFLDFFGLLYVAGCAWFIYRRLASRKQSSIEHNVYDWILLITLLLIGVTGYLIEALRIIRENTPHPELSFAGYGVSKVFEAFGANQSNVDGMHLSLWWIHAIMVFGIIAVLPQTRLLHLVAGMVNLVTTTKQLGRLEPISMDEVEETGRVGAETIQDFTRGQLLSLDACVSCGRCQDVCPAFEAGKPLSPRDVVQDLRGHLNTISPRAKSDDEEGASVHDDVISADTLWACTTCNACSDVCPLAVDPAVLISDMRRFLIGEGTLSGPPAVALQKVGSAGNPWGLPKQERFDWAEGLDVPTVKTNPDFDVLYWIGCAASYDRRAQKIARAVVKLLDIAAVNYATLSNEERCTGESARRMGDEFLFQEQAETNIETLAKYEVKQIITHCPHCLNSFKQDYPQFGGDYEVLHHTQFLSRLILDGKLKVDPNFYTNGVITYHDPCYLARVNGIAEEPRQLIEAVGGETSLEEMERNRCGTSCCGAGGGRMWFDDSIDERVGQSRVAEALETGADTVAVSCPFCLTMVGDGIVAKTADVKVKDVSELLAEAIDS